MAAAFPLNVILKAIDNVSGPLRGIAGKVQAFGKTIAAVRGKIAGLADRAGVPKLVQSMQGLGVAAGGVLSNVAKLGAGLAAMGAAGAASLFAITKSVADNLGAFDDLANRTGVSRERLQEWDYAAQNTGVSSEELGASIEAFSKNLGKAATGTGKAKAVLDGLKIAYKDTHGRVKPLGDLLPVIADKLQKIKDPARQAAAASAIFGGAGVKLLPMLKDGSKGLTDFADRARELGLVVSEDGVKAADNFGDTLLDLQLAFKGIQNTIGVALMPVMTELINKFIELVVKYRPQIEAFAKDFAAELPGRIERLVGFLGDLWAGIQPVIEAVGFLSDKFGGANVALTAVGVVIGGPLILSLLSLVKALGSVGIALLTTPVGWFLAAIAAIAAAVYIIYDSWDEIGAFFTEKWASVKAAFSDGIINGMVKVWLEYNPVTLMMEAFSGLIKYLTGWDLGSILKDKITAAVAAIQSSLPDWAKSLLGIDGAAVTVGATAPAPGQPVAEVGKQAATAGAATPIGQRAAAIGQQAAQTAAGKEDRVMVTLDIKNAPQGSRVTTNGTQGAKFDTNLGYAMGAPN